MVSTASIRDRFSTEIDKAIARAEGVPMRWGRNDCALWTASIVRRVLGYDPAQRFRGKYCSRRGAVRLLTQGNLARELVAVARKHKWKTHEHVNDAEPGDIGLVKNAAGELACVIKHDGPWWVGRLDYGYSLIDSSLVSKAWKVI